MFHGLWVLLSRAFGKKAEPAKIVEPKWLQIARGELGQHEISGSRDNPRIVEYHKATSLGASDDETPWCSAFVNWCMQKAGQPSTRSALARSWLKYGKGLASPQLGCIVVFWRGSPTSSQGHVAFYLGSDGDYVTVLGGNQGDAVTIAKYPKSRVLGYRIP